MHARAFLPNPQVDVAKGIPPKVKTHLYVGMSEMQVRCMLRGVCSLMAAKK